MARFNPYQNSQIADSISGIARALIGSADTDAALARGRASDASARYKDSQTKYQNQLSNYLGVNNSAINDVLGDGNLVRQMFEATGLKSNIGQSIPDGSVGDMIAPNDVTPAVTDGMRGLVRSMFGGVPGNPQQSSAMAQTLADMVNQQEAYRLLSQSAQSPDRQAAIRLGQTPGKYFDEGFANRELAGILLNNLQKQELVNTGNLAERKLEEAGEIEQTNLKNTSEEKRATADRKADSAWKTEIEETKIEIANIDDKRKRQIELDKLEQSQSEQIDKQYIVADGVITMSPALATRMGVTTTAETNNGKKVFAIDVRPGEGKTPVLLGEGEGATTIYVSDANLDKLNIQNIGGKPVIPEGALANPSKKSGSKSQTANTILVGENLTQQQELNLISELKEKIPFSLPDLEDSKMATLESYLIRQIDKKVGKPILDQDGNPTGRNFTLQEAKTLLLNNVLGSGTTTLSVKGKNITVPAYFAQRFDAEYSKYKAQPTEAKLEALKTSVKNVYGGMGYSADEVTRIAKEFK